MFFLARCQGGACDKAPSGVRFSPFRFTNEVWADIPRNGWIYIILPFYNFLDLRHLRHAYVLQSVALRYFNAAGADPEAEVGEDHSRPETHLK